MAYLRPVLSQRLIGPIERADTEWLLDQLDQLEHASTPPIVVYVDALTLDLLAERGASRELLEYVTEALEGQARAQVEVLLNARDSLRHGTPAVAATEAAEPALDTLGNRVPSADVYIGSVRLLCVVCRRSSFWHRNVPVHSTLASFQHVEWAAPSADCYICAQCGYVHWFLPT